MINGTRAASAKPTRPSLIEFLTLTGISAASRSMVMTHRLAFGTDQGCWLQQQVGQRNAMTSRPRQRAQHVFHEFAGAENSIPGVHGNRTEASPKADEKERSRFLQGNAPLLALAGIMVVLFLLILAGVMTL